MLKKLFNSISTIIEAASNAQKFKSAIANSNVNEEDAQHALNNFKDKYIDFTKYVQSQSSIATTIFSENLEDIVTEK